MKSFLRFVHYKFEKSDCGEVRIMVRLSFGSAQGKKNLTLFRRDSPTKTLYSLPRPSVARPREKKNSRSFGTKRERLKTEKMEKIKKKLEVQPKRFSSVR